MNVTDIRYTLFFSKILKKLRSADEKIEKDLKKNTGRRAKKKPGFFGGDKTDSGLDESSSVCEDQGIPCSIFSDFILHNITKNCFDLTKECSKLLNQKNSLTLIKFNVVCRSSVLTVYPIQGSTGKSKFTVTAQDQQIPAGLAPSHRPCPGAAPTKDTPEWWPLLL